MITMSSRLEVLIDQLTVKPIVHESTANDETCSATVPALLPLVYSPSYPISFFKLEYLHPFDVHKWEKVIQRLQAAWRNKASTPFEYLQPNHAMTDAELGLVHPDTFLQNMRTSRHSLVQASEVCILYFMPLSTIQRRLVNPLRYQTMGTILASYFALLHGVAVNIGGGFHHCSANRAQGFCFFADVTLAIRYVWQYSLNEASLARRLNVLIVDCDAHQGNGYASDVRSMTKDERKCVYILDLYNPRIYPGDLVARDEIDREVHLPHRVEDEEYLRLLEFHLEAIISTDKYQPELLIFNAGTDVLRGDPLGHLRISPLGIARRDEIVFRFARTTHRIPIVMLLSGGYQYSNAQVVADSLTNLIFHGLIPTLS